MECTRFSSWLNPYNSPEALYWTTDLTSYEFPSCDEGIKVEVYDNLENLVPTCPVFVQIKKYYKSESNYKRFTITNNEGIAILAFDYYCGSSCNAADTNIFELFLNLKDVEKNILFTSEDIINLPRIVDTTDNRAYTIQKIGNQVWTIESKRGSWYEEIVNPPGWHLPRRAEYDLYFSSVKAAYPLVSFFSQECFKSIGGWTSDEKECILEDHIYSVCKIYDDGGYFFYYYGKEMKDGIYYVKNAQ